MAKRIATPKQLANLARGRNIQFQNQLRQRRINPNPQPQIIREVIREPVINHTTTYNRNTKVQISLFKKFLGVQFFPVEINKNKENLNLNQIISHLFNRINQQSDIISSNQNKISELINYLNSREIKYDENFKKMERRLSELMEENSKLKENENK